MKAKSFICKGCNKSVRFASVTPFLVVLGKCPQCYTKEIMSKQDSLSKES